jgi:DNA-binding HxlR family transcriptional regulator
VKNVDMKLVPATILELLDRNGALKFEELLKRTKKRHSTLTKPALDQTLMEMEIRGLVKVYRLPKEKRRIERA